MASRPDASSASIKSIVKSVKFVRRYHVLLIIAFIGLAVAANILAPFWKIKASANAVPISAPGEYASLERIDHLFPGTGTDNIASVILESDTPIRDDARAYMASLADRLRSDTKAVRAVVDMSSDPLTAPVAQSADRRSIFIQTWLRGALGSPEGLASVEAVRASVHALPGPKGVRPYVTGPAATAAARAAAADQYGALLVLAVVVTTAGLVLALTRSLLVAGGVLVTAYLALAIALPVQSMLGPSWRGSPTAFSLALTIALTVGASLAYTLLLKNYRLHVHADVNDDAAFTRAYRSTTPTIVGSSCVFAVVLIAAEVIDLPELQGFGVSAGMAVAAATLLVLTLAPGWARRAGQRPLAQRSALPVWAARLRLCAWVFRRPALTLAVIAVIILGCAAQLPGMKVSFSEPGMLPQGAEPDAGYAVATRHFTANRLFPQTVVIEGHHDLRNPAGLLAIDRVTRQLMAVPGTRLVQSASWPAGLPWPDATLAHQLGELNGQLQSDALSAAPLTTAITRLPATVDQLTSSLDQFQHSVNRGVAGLAPLGTSLDELHSSVTRLNDTANTLSHDADPVRQWMAGFPDCATDILCAQALKVIQPVDSLLGEMSQLTSSTKGLSDVLTTATQNVSTAVGTITDIRRTLADVRPLIDESATTLNRLMPRLTRLTAFINVLADDLSNSPAGGFYLSQQAIDAPSYQAVKTLMLSADGHATRLFVYAEGDIFGADGARVAAAVVPAVAEATKYGPLADSAVDSTGVGSVVNALGSRWHVDFRTALVTSVVLILLISSVTLRSIRAGMTVAAATLAGFVTGLGTCVFVWSHLLGAQISWTAPLISLIIVAAVGGDDAFRLTARALPRPRAKAERGVSYYGGAAPAFATVLIWAAAVFIWVTAVAGSTAVLTSSFGQIAAIVGSSLALSYVGFRALLIAAASWRVTRNPRHVSAPPRALRVASNEPPPS